MMLLKKCPNCGMTVSTEGECPVCKCDLFNEPPCDARFEKYKLNKYFLPFFFRKSWFLLCCILLIIIKTAIFGINVNIEAYIMYKVLCVIFLAFGFAEAFFPEFVKRIRAIRESENFIDSTSGKYKYLSFGILALFLGLL